jgi:hypothetical protein
LTGAQVFGVLLIVLGVLYALMYVGWLPHPRWSASLVRRLTGTAAADDDTTGSVDEPVDEATIKPVHEPTSKPTSAPGLPRPLTLAWAEGTYLSTSIAVSRHERVPAAAGLGVRAKAAMVVDDSTVRWEREGIDEVRVARPRLREVSLGRQLSDWLPLQARPVLVSWTDESGDHHVTRFLPRSRADSAALVSAVQRLMKIGAPGDDAPTRPDGTL